MYKKIKRVLKNIYRRLFLYIKLNSKFYLIMKRKTNLFYTNGPDSKFITFSNYTECLTGNFLSLETKLFPDKFLCLKINNLNSSTKPLFIKYLAAYYENKLATLRDNNIKLNVNIESNILPLAYLINAIIRVCKINENDNSWVLNGDKLDYLVNGIKRDIAMDNDDNDDDHISKITSASRNLITYIGEVTEQDYNGTYTDTICTIDLNAYNEGELIIDKPNNFTDQTVSTTDTSKLYGWKNDNIIFEDYENVKPIFDVYDSDSIGEYSYSASIDQSSLTRTQFLSQLKLVPIDQNSTNNNDKTLEFNIIIPLFSLVNKNISHQEWSIYSESSNKSYKYIDLANAKSISTTDNYIYDVPLGMWINGDGDEDTFIKLEKDPNLKLYPSWSLLISSQFKPFPYSNKLEESNRNTSTLDAHATYAEVLSKINNLLDKFNDYNLHIKNLENKISMLESNIQNIATENNISDINEKLLTTEKKVLDELDDMKRKFYGYINNVTWSSAG